MPTISYDDFSKMDLRVATILAAAPHTNADRLLVLQVSIGNENRQVVAGVRKQYEGQDLVGRQIVVVVNLEPVVLRGETSTAMLLAAKDDAGNLALVSPDHTIADGSAVR